MTTDRTGILLLVSGPSGSGKTTLCRRLADEGEAIYSTSCTTRPSRDGELDGHDYHFLDRDTFEQKVTNGEFLEYAEVHGNLYGTLKTEVLSHLIEGVDVVMDIDVQGADQVRNSNDTSIDAALVDVFVMPHTEEELVKRLTGRGSDSQDVIELRMKNALGEITHCSKYTYRLLSNTREQDYHQFKSLIVAERLKLSRFKNH
ncbi:MAG: guanylate kinase [Akkermansiaceae bacterium]|nr:guanylate kinase [Akkermansiaceae bacterium]